MLLLFKDVSLVIRIGQGYWLGDKGSSLECHRFDDEGAPLECHRLDDKGLTLASHYYTKVMARWLEILTSYTG